MTRKQKNFMNVVNMIMVAVVGGLCSCIIYDNIIDWSWFDKLLYNNLSRTSYGVIMSMIMIMIANVSAIIVQEIVRYFVVKVHNYRFAKKYN